ncbi:Helix-turn-helix domain-containing protein [Pelagirhabdus alkalitolerans]|uniref:Helix-turn-helix domain-containing protein n=1 Tax=Pelagirhabdus alkalitolerans TaxID=1612202 RepID=A0A1G6J013_9BACI|nr:helix-turn-helix domain-containing protein [Pelagirhabdus alkalitolerans]SDC12107.1 Helix-turn-helix domain-containing protein [Pelagirhabdus alkalitolerans]
MTIEGEKRIDQLYHLNIFYYSTGIPIAFIEKHTDLIKRLPNNEYLNPVLPRNTLINRQALLAAEGIDSGKCITFEDEYFQHYFSVKIEDKGETIGLLLAGPVQIIDITFQKLHELFLHKSLSFSSQKMIKDHYEITPKLTTNQFKYIKLFLENINNFEYEPFNIEDSDTDESQIPITPISILETQPVSHHSLKLEEELIEALKNKDRAVLDILAHFDEFSIPDIGNGDPVRAFKNVLISAVAVVIREVNQTGIDFKQLQQFSDRYINKVEATSHLQELTSMYYTLFFDLLNLIEASETETYSKPVNQAMSYIREHLSHPLTLKEISSIIYLNPKYFSKIFKKETGMTIFTYISIERVKVAKYFLKNTNETIIDISNYVGYSNQSYFTQVFKKVEGVTPTQYRAELTAKQNG